MAAPDCLAQSPQTSAGKSASIEPAPAALAVVVLEGNNAINSIPLLRSNAPIVEIRDENDFPVEGAVVVFTMPEQGPSGTFAGGQKVFSTRSDSHGQAAAPLFTPVAAGKFEIKVTATAGSRKGAIVIGQTNSTGEYSGPPIARKPLYKKRLPWVLAGAGVAAAVIAVVLINRKSSSHSATTATQNTITIAPGSPIFH